MHEPSSLEPTVLAQLDQRATMTIDSNLSADSDSNPTKIVPIARPVGERSVEPGATVLSLADLAVYYGAFKAVEHINLSVESNEITAFIGPSGCGKSTVLRAMNRMHDLTRGARVEGSVIFKGVDLYHPKVDPVEVRRRVGMVFQRPNPFPKSIYDNVAYGPKVNGLKVNLDERVEEALTKAALFDEVKDHLKKSAFSLSGGQQQRLCIARALAVEPDVLLMDEPCSALDPVATQRIEELMLELRATVTIVIVTHNLQQAARVSDRTAFFSVDTEAAGRIGHLIEFDTTDKIFTNPASRVTENYISGRFG